MRNLDCFVGNGRRAVKNLSDEWVSRYVDESRQSLKEAAMDMEALIGIIKSDKIERRSCEKMGFEDRRKKTDRTFRYLLADRCFKWVKIHQRILP